MRNSGVYFLVLCASRNILKRLQTSSISLLREFKGLLSKHKGINANNINLLFGCVIKIQFAWAIVYPVEV